MGNKKAPVRHGQGRLVALLLTAVVIWSTVFPISKLVLPIIPPATLAAIRFSCGAVVLLAYAIRSTSWRQVLDSLRRHWGVFVALGSVGIWLNNLLQNLGLNLSSSCSTSLLSTTDPIFSALLSAIFLREALTKRKLGGLFLAFLGVCLVTTNGQRITDWGNGLGNLLVISSALCYSIYTILSKRILHLVEPAIVVAWATFFGAILLCGSAVLIEQTPVWASLTGANWLALVYLSIIPTSVAVLAYFYVLQQMPASEAAIGMFLIPIFSIVWSTLLLHEQVTLAMLAGGTLIIVGVGLAMLASKQRKVTTTNKDRGESC